jgi:glycine/D-amino acid oxidase-like deaminating enzyme
VASAIVIGGGFFGCTIALHLRRRGLREVTLCERERTLLTRASYSNQARVHAGYHYPRSFVTAQRSRANLNRFAREFAPAIKRDFLALYAIAAQRSKVMPRQYERFMDDIGARHESLSTSWRGLFDPRRIAALYSTEEYAFDAVKLRELLAAELARSNVKLQLGTEVRCIRPLGERLAVELCGDSGEETLEAPLVINCTYARTNHTASSSPALTELKHELAEIALIDPPLELKALGITVMDGPFFSCMPFPAEGCHSLTHVRYTPQGSFTDGRGQRDPLALRAPEAVSSRYAHMLADAARFVPALARARYRRSLFEIKTVLVHHEVDDGRPILLRREFGHPGAFSVLGGKLDNVYDVLSELDRLLEQSGAPAVTGASAIEAA